MHIITHYLTGWHSSNFLAVKENERFVYMVASIIPDIDGVGIIAEFFTKNTASPLLWWTEYHHVLGHNLLFSMAFCISVFYLYNKKVAFLSFLLMHLHFFMDIVGSGGADGDRWPLYYFYPFNKTPYHWQGQWEMNSPVNIIITLVLILCCIPVFIKFKKTPFEWILPFFDKKIKENFKKSQ